MTPTIYIFIGGAALLAASGGAVVVQTKRLETAKVSIATLTGDLASCRLNVTASENRRANEDSVTLEPRPAERLQPWQRPDSD